MKEIFCNLILLSVLLVTAHLQKMKNPEDPLPGGRIIILKSGQRELKTWIGEYGGKKDLSCSYPASFMLKKKVFWFCFSIFIATI